MTEWMILAEFDLTGHPYPEVIFSSSCSRDACSLHRRLQRLRARIQDDEMGGRDASISPGERQLLATLGLSLETFSTVRGLFLRIGRGV